MKTLAHENKLLSPEQREIMFKEVETAVRQLLDALHIDQENDSNTKETAQRVTKMYINEWFGGRYDPMPKVTTFPNDKEIDQLYTVGPITIHSTCSHHLAPIVGKAWVGVIPGEELIGLSKFARLARWIFARPQIQEDATKQFADLLEDLIRPKGLIVVVKATHMCMTSRGVKDPASLMTTSDVRGLLKTEAAARQEFFALIKEN